MSRIRCEREDEVRQACRSGLWTIALREHTSYCTACADVVIVAEFLLHEAEIVGPDARLPSSNIIWWRAQLAAKDAALVRAIRPITLITILSFFVGALSLLWLVTEFVETRAASFSSPQYPAWQHLLDLYANSTPLVMTTGTLLCLVFGSLYLVWHE